MGQSLSTDKVVTHSKRDKISRYKNEIKDYILERVLSLRDNEFRSRNQNLYFWLSVSLLLFYFDVTNNLLCNYVFRVPFFKF